MKSKERAQLTFNDVRNRSLSKHQYSFPKQPRFVDRLTRAKTILDKFYTITDQKSQIGGFFTKSRRVITQNNQRSPSPQQYNPKMMQTKRSTSFCAGRSQCKLQSIFYTTTLHYPGPGKYDPHQSKSSSCIYIGKRLKTEQNKSNSPGPIYALPSTINQKSKILSNFPKKGTIKIMLPTSKSKMRTQLPNLMKQTFVRSSKDAVLTYKGSKSFGKSGTIFSIQRQKRFTRNYINKLPGPNLYQSFSDFIPPKTSTLKK